MCIGRLTAAWERDVYHLPPGVCGACGACVRGETLNPVTFVLILVPGVRLFCNRREPGPIRLVTMSGGASVMRDGQCMPVVQFCGLPATDM
jgi:hypothetical protein